MSLICCVPVLECVYCLVCARWAYKRCLHSAGHESEYWSVASPIEFEPVPRLCRLIQYIYDPDDFANEIDPNQIITRKTYKDTHGRAPPYVIYLDHDNEDVVLALRGLNLVKNSDYATLLDNRLGKKKYEGGYVHNGLLKAAGWVLDKECDVLKDLLERYPRYGLTFAGHSLGAGVAAMLTMVVLQNMERLGIRERKRVRCYAIAPARCMSLNLAVRCARDTFISDEKMLKDPRRLYAPGRLYHIVERKPFRFQRYPPVVKTAVPVDGRFEHIVLSCNATKDHAIIWIEKEARRALDLMQKEETNMNIPPKQKMERQETLERDHNEEHRAALRRAVMLAVPHAFNPIPEYGTFDESSHNETGTSNNLDGSQFVSKLKSQRVSWNELIDSLFDRDESGRMVFRPSISETEPLME